MDFCTCFVSFETFPLTQRAKLTYYNYQLIYYEPYLWGSIFSGSYGRNTYTIYAPVTIII